MKFCGKCYIFLINAIVILLIILVINQNKNSESFYNYTSKTKTKPNPSQLYSRHLSFMDRGEAVNFFKKHVSCRLYLSSIDPRTIIFKLGPNKILSNYPEAIDNFTISEKKKLTSKVLNLPHSPLLAGDWNFAKTRPELEFGMPFTLADVILLPSLDKIGNLSRILVHEKIHVLERQFSSQFNQFLIHKLDFRLVKREGKLPFIPFSNPDGLQLDRASWIFYNEMEGIWYCPFLTIDKRGILNKLAVSVKFINNNTVKITNRVKEVVSLLSKKFPSCPTHHLYHPYEIMAELGMIFIMDGSSGNKQIDYFYRNLIKS